jgi:hypothetical protein
VFQQGLPDAVVDNANDVNAPAQGPHLVGTAPRRREPVQAGQLGWTYGFERMSVIQASTGLDLSDYEDVALEGHNVNFAVRAAPVAIYDPHSLGLQELSGQCLAMLAKQVFCSHDHHLRYQLSGWQRRTAGGHCAMWVTPR